jgi:predicted AAA+ superfamily ATPase
MTISPEAVQVLRDLNPWWARSGKVRPEPPSYRRPAIRDLSVRLRRPRGLIEVVRGPRQVGKTTGIYQIIEELLASGTAAKDILFIRFDLEVLRDELNALRELVRWYVTEVRGRGLASGAVAYIFLDEIHKLRRWDEEVKHLTDTFRMRLLLTGSSSVLVARGGRESLAGRTFTTELPTFTFREVIEAWKPELAAALPEPLRFNDAFDADPLIDSVHALQRLKPQQKLSVRRWLERYYNRGGYPRLYTGEVDDDRWADYLGQTVLDSVLGADIPDLFPVEQPGLLRFVYLQVARQTGQEVVQRQVAELASAVGFSAKQPTVGRYLHYLADALLIREFRRYPLAKKISARVPAKMTVSDLGVRNAMLRGAPSLWESDPGLLGPLVETLVQANLRDHNLQVHFFRDYDKPGDRRAPIREVDFVAESIDGQVLPVEVKFRKRVGPSDLAGLGAFRRRFDVPFGIVVSREQTLWDSDERLLYVPLQDFLLSFHP